MLFVEGAPLEGGGWEQPPKPICEGRDPEPDSVETTSGLGRTGARGARDPPPGAPQARRAQRAAYEARGGMGGGGASEGGSRGGNQGGGGAARPLPPQTTADRVGGG